MRFTLIAFHLLVLLVHEQQASQKRRTKDSLFCYYICSYYDLQTISAVERCRHLICHLSTFRRFPHCYCSHIYFHKKLNDDLKDVNFVMLAIH